MSTSGDTTPVSQTPAELSRDAEPVVQMTISSMDSIMVYVRTLVQQELCAAGSSSTHLSPSLPAVSEPVPLPASSSGWAGAHLGVTYTAQARSGHIRMQQTGQGLSSQEIAPAHYQWQGRHRGGICDIREDIPQGWPCNILSKLC